MVKFTDEVIEAVFGVDDAENETPERLKQYFYRNKAYESISSALPIRIVVGHKGVGKSALLKVCHLEDNDAKQAAIWIQPSDVKELFGSTTKDFNELVDVWKTGILKIIYHKTLERFLTSESERESAIVLNSLGSLITAIKNRLSTKYGSEVEHAANAVIANFMKDEVVRVYVDDLDRGWKARPSDITNISALLNAIRDLCGADRRLQFRIGLRSDVYYLVRTSDESTDKIDRNVTWLTWSNHEILVLMAKRIATYFGNDIDEQKLIKLPQPEIARQLEPVIESRFRHVGKWENAPMYRVLLSMTRRRPRDLVKLFYASSKEAYKNDHEKIKTQDIRSIFAYYSNERLQDIINEFRTELPQIEALVHGMRPTTKERKTSENYLYTNDALVVKLKNIISQNNFSFTNGRGVDPKSLAEFLYKIDFITARKNDGDVIRRLFFDQNRFLQNQFVDYGFSWEVHPAYRWALQPGDSDSIFRNLDLTETDA